MDGTFAWRGTLIEIIEMIGEYLIIQEIHSKTVHIIYCSELDQTTNNSKIESESNIYSLGAWRECQEKAKENQSRQRQKQSFKRQPKRKLKLISL